jgi:2-polyprenyl-6-methoxyphenol hydroxylase-like FAD-dependent oxidoreductase
LTELTVAEPPAAVFERLNDVRPPGQPTVQLDTAVVLGGSIAGLLAARVLADHAKSVAIIERDERGRQTEDAGRAGVPQGRQAHILLPAGRAQLERWYPGFTKEAQDRGAVLCSPERTAAYSNGVEEVQTDNKVMLASSRPFLEALIRRRTLALPNVRVITGQATGLTYRGGAVSGVRYLTADGERQESAGWVVDAMGRASKLSDWLQQDGWERPTLERMPVGVNYATAFFKRAEDRPPIAAAINRPSPRFPDQPLGTMHAVENGQWQVLLAGYGDNRPGRTPEDFSAASAQLPPIFAEAAAGELVGEIHTYHQADSRRRNFIRLQHFPARLISVGDAVASFNPVYGQGMSSAALHASCLSEYLRGHPDLARPARQFFALEQVVVDAAWGISTSADAARPGAPQNPSARMRVQRWAMKQILAAAVTDKKIATRFNAVAFMTAHPASLVTPGTVIRALAVRRAMWWPGRSPRPAAQPASSPRAGGNGPGAGLPPVRCSPRPDR